MKKSILTLVYFIPALLLGLNAFAQESKNEMKSAPKNFNSFSATKYADQQELQLFSTSQGHPEYGVLPYNAPCEDCIEIIEERTQFTRKFLTVGKNGKEVLVQSGYSPLHYKDASGQWITYDPTLKPIDNLHYGVNNTYYKIEINAQEGFIYFENKRKGYEPLILHKDLSIQYLDQNDNILSTSAADWSNISAGDQGARVTNIFPNVDLEIFIARENIKTSFVVKQDIGNFRISESLEESVLNRLDSPSENMDYLHFFEQGEGAYIVGRIKIFGKEEKRDFVGGQYEINQNQLIYKWNQEDYNNLTYPIIIDPTVTSNGTLPQASITGAGDFSNFGGFNAGCFYNLTAATPANCEITDIQWSFQYIAQNGAVMADGACRFYYGACISPAAAGFYWFCNDPVFGGTCTGANISIIGDFGPCVPAPQCAPYNMNFSMEFFDAWGGGNALNCDPTYITAGSDWTMTVIGETVDEPSPPTSSAGNTICEGQSTNLTATATYGVPPYTYTWDNGGGVGNPVNVSPVTTTTYTCTITDACGVTATNSITINVNPAPDPGTNGTVSLCPSDPITSLLGELGGTPDATGTWSGPSALGGGSAGNFNPATNAAGVYTYTVNGTAPCTNASATVTVTLNAAPVAGTNGAITYCESDPSSDLFNELGGSPNAGGTWSPALASGTGVFNPAVDAAGTYTYTVTNGCGSASADVVVTVNPDPDAGTNGSLSICNTDPATNLFNELGGTPDATGTWSPAMASGTGVFDPAVDPAGTYTYTVTNSCGTVSADVVVTVITSPDAGTNGATSFCPSDPSANLFGFLGGTPMAGGAWSPAMASGTGVFNPAVDPAGTYTYTVTTSCGIATADVVVTLNSDPNAGANGSLSICVSDPSTDLFNELGGAPDAGGAWSPAMASGTGVYDPSVDPAGTYTYTVTNVCGSDMADVVVTIITSPDAGSNGATSFCPGDPSADLFGFLGGTPMAGGTWSPALTSGTGVFDPAVDAAGTYTYTISTSCGVATADVVVTINPDPVAGTNGNLTICTSDPSTDLFNELGGSPDAGGTWSPAMASGTGVFDPAVDPAGTYTYTVTNGCGSTSADVVVSVVTAVDAGTNGATAYCPTDAGGDLFNELGGTPMSGGTWSPAMASGSGVFDPSVDAGGTYTYTVTTSCGTASADVVVTVHTPPNIVANANPGITLCDGDQLTLSGSGGVSYTWTGGVTNGVAFTPTLGTSNYTVTGTDANGCTNTDDITITVNDCSNPTAIIGGNPDTICVNDCVTFFDMSTGTNLNAWNWDLGNGLTFNVQNPPMTCYASPGTYTITLTVTDDVGTDQTSVELVVIECNPPDPGFSISDPDICIGECITLTDTSLYGPTSWEWDFSESSVPNTSTIPNPTICPDSLGTFTITLTVTNQYGTTSTTQTITVNAIPTVIAGADTTINMNEEVPLDVTVSPTGGTFQWSGESTFCSDCQTTAAEPLFNETFTVVYTTAAGCANSDSTVVTVNFEDVVDVPNAFTPNADNNNDILFVKGDGIVAMRFVIYNRYGQKVFETTEQSIGWDGSLNGRPENPGVFAWYVEYTLIDGTSNVKQGNVTLIR